MSAFGRISTIQEDLNNFRNWHRELVTQIPETIKYRTNLKFIIFYILREKNSFWVRAIMDLNFEYSHNPNMGKFFEEMRQKVERAETRIIANWWRDRTHGAAFNQKPWPKDTSIWGAWDNKGATLSEELEKERLCLQRRLIRIRKAYTYLDRLKELSKIEIADMRSKILLGAQKNLNAAIKLIRRRTKCRTFLVDTDAFQRKVIEFLDQPGVDISFTYLL